MSPSANRWLWRVLKVALGAAIIGGVIYWVKFSPIRTETHRVERGKIVAEVMGTGTLEARVKVTISPKIPGRIETIRVDQGDRVSAGDVLVELDDKDLTQQVEVAQATLATAEAALQRVESDRRRSIAVLEQAKLHHKRTESLISNKAASQSDLDKAVEALAIAGAGIASAEAAIVESNKKILAAERLVAYHQARLADTEIVAPFAGLIVRRRLDPGDVVVLGSPILLLVSLDELWITAWVDETEMAGLQVDQAARVVFRSEPERSYPGKVARLGRETDRETREFIVDVDVLELPNNWAVGQRTEVYIQTASAADATIIPTTFIRRRDNGPGVFVDIGQQAQWRTVQLGLHNAEWAEVVDGVQAGETIVISRDPKKPLSEGRRIAAP
jgi:HlyD family secretion protein